MIAGADPQVNPRGALIDAMARSCMERGYMETTVEDLLEETGLSRAEFDRHFKDKEDCGVAAVEAVLTAGIEIVSVSFTGDMSEGESTLRALLGLLDLFAVRPEMGSLAMTDSRQRMPRTAFDRYDGGFAILRAMLDRLRSQGGEESAAPPCGARGALGGAEAVVRRELAEEGAAGLPALLPDLIYSALIPFLGQEEALRIARQGEKLLQERAAQELFEGNSDASF
jgi:AcrR family transcriptional regulator